MTERPRFFDDLAGVAGGAFSALNGLREEAESMVRARVDEVVRKLDLVKREDLDAVQEMAANARAGQEAAELRVAALEARLATLERVSAAGAADSGASEADPETMPKDTHPPDSSGNGSEVAPAALPPAAGAPGSATTPTDMA